MERRLLEGDVLDHVAAALPRRHGLEDARPAIDGADAGRREHLVAGEDEEVGIQRLHVDRHVRDRLRPVDDGDGAVTMGDGDHVRDRRDRAERVRHLAHRGDARPRREQLLVFFEDDLPGVVHRRHLQHGALLGGELLPGHDVGVVLEMRDDDLVAFLDVAPAPRLGDEVDALRRAAHKDDAVRRRRIDEGAHLGARRLVGVGGTRGQRVGAAVDVGVFVFVEVDEAIDHALRLLRRRAVVEPHQRAPVDVLLQDREVAPDGVGIERTHAGDAGGGCAEAGVVLEAEPAQVEYRHIERKRQRPARSDRCSGGRRRTVARAR